MYVAEAEHFDPTKIKSRPQKFAFEGNLYCFSKYSSDGKIKFLRCIKRYIHDCKAILHTKAEREKVVKTIGIHSHGINTAEVQVNMIRAATEETSIVAINNINQNITCAIQGELPNPDAMEKTARNTSCTAQSNELASIIIPQEYKIYKFGLRNEQFLLADSIIGNIRRILILGRQSNIDLAHQMQNLHVDGTFCRFNCCLPKFLLFYLREGDFLFLFYKRCFLIR
ncbi:hypothetical protein HZS_3935 [Henneguya salminicola]|nr:hypothetical protein HZS_3935 [Henneguya salminicola]